MDYYNSTLRALIDKYATVEIQRVTARSSLARWYDGECRDMKCQTRKLEQQHRRLRTTESETAWCQQFDAQRRLY